MNANGLKYTRGQLKQMADKLLSKKKRPKKKKVKVDRLARVNGYADDMRKKPTSLEVKHIQILHNLMREFGIKAKTEPQFVERIEFGFVIIDVVIFINGKKIAWEIDGPSHGLKKKKDAQRDAALAKKGYITLRTTYLNSDIEIRQRILSALYWTVN